MCQCIVCNAVNPKALKVVREAHAMLELIVAERHTTFGSDPYNTAGNWQHAAMTVILFG